VTRRTIARIWITCILIQSSMVGSHGYGPIRRSTVWWNKAFIRSTGAVAMQASLATTIDVGLTGLSCLTFGAMPFGYCALLRCSDGATYVFSYKDSLRPLTEIQVFVVRFSARYAECRNSDRIRDSSIFIRSNQGVGDPAPVGGLAGSGDVSAGELLWLNCRLTVPGRRADWAFICSWCRLARAERSCGPAPFLRAFRVDDFARGLAACFALR